MQATFQKMCCCGSRAGPAGPVSAACRRGTGRATSCGPCSLPRPTPCGLSCATWTSAGERTRATRATPFAATGCGMTSCRSFGGKTPRWSEAPSPCTGLRAWMPPFGKKHSTARLRPIPGRTCGNTARPGSSFRATFCKGCTRRRDCASMCGPAGHFGRIHKKGAPAPVSPGPLPCSNWTRPCAKGAAIRASSCQAVWKPACVAAISFSCGEVSLRAAGRRPPR